MTILLRKASTQLAGTSRRWLSTMDIEAPLLLSPKQVQEISQNEHVAVLDASWFMPNSPRNGKTEYLDKRIPGAQLLDLDEVASTHELGLKHMMPQSRVFAEACGQLGISPSTHVVIYDTHGVFSSPRALFMFRAFGHQKSSIINGGLPRWLDEGYPLETQAPQTRNVQKYPEPEIDLNTIRSYEQMVSNSSLDPNNNATAEIVLDARSAGRYNGTDPEPRPGLSSGHIPNSFSLPFNVFLQQQKSKTGDSTFSTFLEPEALKLALDAAVGQSQAQAIIEGNKPVITSCGSGMTAGILWLGLRLLGVKNIALYDESWTGYAMRPTSNIAKS